MPVTPHLSSDGHAGDFFSILLQLQSRPSLFHRREKREHSIQPGHPK